MLIFVKSMVAGERVPPDSCMKRSAWTSGSIKR